MAHFAAVLMYAWPNQSKGRLFNYSFAYVYPYFHQNWTLFVPPPKENFNIYVKYNTTNKQQDWKDLYYEVNSRHQNNRLGGNEALLIAFSNALRYYFASSPQENYILPENTDGNYAILKLVIQKYLWVREGETPQDLKIIVGSRELNGKTIYHYDTN